MRIRNKIYTIFLTGLLLSLAACGSNSMPSDSGKIIAPAPGAKSFEDKANEWFDFVGRPHNSDEGLQTLKQLSQGGCCKRTDNLKDYINLLSGQDLAFANSIDQIKLVNADLFHSYQCLTQGNDTSGTCDTDLSTSFAEFHIRKIIDDYAKLVEQAKIAQDFIVRSAQILDFTMIPATDIPQGIAEPFIRPINVAIFKAVSEDSNLFAGTEIPQIDASLLKAVSLQTDGALQSFFQFAVTTPDVNGRGLLNLTPTELNPLLLVVTLTI